jgi:hypothetical protein
VRLILFHPTVAYRDCGHCQKYQYDEDKGRPIEHPKGSGKYVKRHAKLPCETSTGCAKGTPDNQLSLSQRNQQAYLHYRQCKAVGDFPDDPIVRQNAGLIRAVEESAERERQNGFEKTLVELVMAARR